MGTVRTEWSGSPEGACRKSRNCTHHESITNKELDDTMKSFWDLESFGIKQPLSDPVCDRFASTLQLKIRIPWRDHHKDLPDNESEEVERVTAAKPESTARISLDQLEQGIVEEVKDSEVAPRTTHYLPVIRQDKETTKVRVWCLCPGRWSLLKRLLALNSIRRSLRYWLGSDATRLPILKRHS